MLNKTKISAVLFTLSLATTAISHAEEVSLENMVGQMLSQSVKSVQQELRNDIKGSVLTAAHQFSLYEDGPYAINTSITDLDSQVEVTVRHEAE
jgi:hypothetical protein